MKSIFLLLGFSATAAPSAAGFADMMISPVTQRHPRAIAV
jgi:hypothetical protein